MFYTVSISKLESAGMLVNMNQDARCIVIMAHGAGAGMSHAFLEDLAQLLQERQIGVIRFNFRYISQGKKFPTSQKQSIEDWTQVYQEVKALFPDLPIFIGGKSYGGRMASHMILEQNEQTNIKGIIYLGFPLHSPKNVSDSRASHMHEINVPQLFLQGTNDQLAEISLISEVCERLNNSTLMIFDHADHSFNIPKRNGGNLKATKVKLAETIHKWCLSQLATD